MAMTYSIRPPAVAGTFYPDNQSELRKVVDGYLNNAISVKEKRRNNLKALLIPHAGYLYSGPIAGNGYSLLRHTKGKINRVWLIGPAHHLLFTGLATTSYDLWETPLGQITIDPLCGQLIKKYPTLFAENNPAHRDEHCLEVQIPFLQQLFSDFTIIPLLTGEFSLQAATKIINTELRPDDLIIISSDLSHYLLYNQAMDSDQETIDSIIALEEDYLVEENACGLTGIKILMQLAKLNKWKAELIDYRNSGDTAGDKDRVVGYASIGFWG